ncbi:hypothetical protein ERJ70_18710 [Sediminibacillus dalangtanensis]|uniref:Zinc-finger of transposase IS204/IS1001/IS1096/IS1165 n=1 Tax=Sediminibacillus dalangtanensis TaxID=2729421 RepID=A0ABX7VW05_9BACI|nr:hypothetical protein [Sediminibacillus dalangtanensis]QTN01137.1 hypothetical protein ERJ70_18710 [Sediminibacillus dalangtanensis]
MILEKASNHKIELLHQEEEETQFSFVMKVTSKQTTCPRCGSLSNQNIVGIAESYEICH